MKEYAVLITETAENDLRGIYEYIAFHLHSPGIAEKQLERLETAVEKLGYEPERFGKYGDEVWQSRNLRMMPVDNYCVLYIPDTVALRVTVIRVMYKGRDIKTQLMKHTGLINDRKN